LCYFNLLPHRLILLPQLITSLRYFVTLLPSWPHHCLITLSPSSPHCCLDASSLFRHNLSLPQCPVALSQLVIASLHCLSSSLLHCLVAPFHWVKVPFDPPICCFAALHLTTSLPCKFIASIG
jgi:hypothetical protein